MSGRAVGLLAIALAVACRSRITLGDPDAGLGASDTAPPAPAPARCTGVPSRAEVASADPELGDFRAMVVGSGVIHALFMRSTGHGVVARVPVTGGALVPVATVGLDPTTIALSAESFVFVAARGSSQVFRIDAAGAVVVAEALGPPGAVVADGRGGAFWTVPSRDLLVASDFGSGAPRAIATTPRPTAMIRAENTLYIGGNRVLRAFDLDRDEAPRKVAEYCGDGVPAVAGQALYCTDADSVVRVDLASGAAVPVAVAQTGARDLVAGAGRLFWRTAPSSTQSVVMALPLDGTGEPTLVEAGPPGPLLLALDGCDLYFTAGRTIVHRAL